MSSVRWDRAWVCVPVLTTLVAYRGVLHGYFYGDDFLHFYEFVNAPFGHVLTRPFAGHLYIVRNLVLAGVYKLFGMWSPPYFVMMLALHLAGVGLLFATIRVLTGSPMLASIVAATWGALPIHGGALAWVSVIGELLALVLCLLVVHQIARCTVAERVLSGRRAAALSTLLVAGATCFGTGIATALSSPLLVLLLVPLAQRTNAALRWFSAVPLAVVVLYVLCWSLSGDHDESTVRFAIMSLGALGSAGLVLKMFAGMFVFGLGQLGLGPLVPGYVVRGELTPGMAACAATLLVAGFWHAGRRERAVSAAFLLAASAQYGLVALGRATLYQMASHGFASFFGEPRYQYGPTALLAVACALAIRTLGKKRSVPRRFALGFTVCWFGATLALALWRPTPIDERPATRVEVANFQATLDQRIDEAPAGGPVYLPNRLFASVGLLLAAAPEVYPGWAATFTVFFRSNAIRGHRVFFLERNPKTVAAVRRLEGSLISDIILQPDQAPGS
jgi:hypothetical protein